MSKTKGVFIGPRSDHPCQQLTLADFDTQSNLDAYIEKFAEYAEYVDYAKYAEYAEYAEYAG